MDVAVGIYTPLVPKSPKEPKTVREAADEIGVHYGTIWRWLENGWLTRYYSRVGRRKTVVDMVEVRQLKTNPPVELPKPKADDGLGREG